MALSSRITTTVKLKRLEKVTNDSVRTSSRRVCWANRAFQMRWMRMYLVSRYTSKAKRLMKVHKTAVTWRYLQIRRGSFTRLLTSFQCRGRILLLQTGKRYCQGMQSSSRLSSMTSQSTRMMTVWPRTCWVWRIVTGFRTKFKCIWKIKMWCRIPWTALSSRKRPSSWGSISPGSSGLWRSTTSEHLPGLQPSRWASKTAMIRTNSAHEWRFLTKTSQ